MLTSERITLRAVEPEDLDLMYIVENDTRLWPVGSATVPFSAYALKQFLSETHNDIYRDGQLRLVIEGTDGVVVRSHGFVFAEGGKLGLRLSFDSVFHMLLLFSAKLQRSGENTKRFDTFLMIIRYRTN